LRRDSGARDRVSRKQAYFKLEDFHLKPLEPLATNSKAAARLYGPAVIYAAAFVSSKGTNSVKEAYTKTNQNSRHSFKTIGEEIQRRRSLALIRSAISVLLILPSAIIPLLLERHREIHTCKIRV
jgi:hypothetical protein